MKKADAVKYFGGVGKLADALGIASPSVSEWGERVPPLRQFQIEHITKGRLKAEASLKKPA